MSEQDQPAPSAPLTDGNSIGIIDVECLIDEVRKYPSLHTQSDNDQVDEGGMQEEWNNVCSALFSQWNILCSAEKIEKQSAVQRKWKELKENFFKVGGGTVQHLSPAAKKKRQQRYESMSFLIQKEDLSDMDMGDNALQKNNNDQYTGDLEDFEQSLGDATEEIPIPSPPEHVPETPSTAMDLEDFNDFMKKFEQPPQEDDSIDEYPVHPNVQFAQILVPLLNHLTREQLLTVWPKIVNIVKEATEPKKKIIILQSELKYKTGEGPIDFVQSYPPVHMPSIVEHYAPPLQGSSLVDHYSAQLQGASLVDQYSAQLQGATLIDHYSAQLQGPSLAEITLPLIQDMESLPPSCHGRPTNELGEIIYPETDTEDLDDV